VEEAPGQVHVRPSLTPVKQPPVLLFHTRAAQQGESQDVRVRAERKAGRCAALQQKRRLTTISLTKKGRIEVYRTSSEQSNPLSARHEHRSRLEGASGVQPSPDTGAAQKCTLLPLPRTNAPPASWTAVLRRILGRLLVPCPAPSGPALPQAAAPAPAAGCRRLRRAAKLACSGAPGAELPQGGG